MNNKTLEELDAEREELSLLKARAKQMGIQHHPSIGLAKLKAKVNDVLSDEPEAPVKEIVEEEVIASPNKQVFKGKPKTALQLKRERAAWLRRDAAKLIRIRVANMNPNKKEWEGEMYTVSNSVVGTFKKYVPFNNENGWHVPNIIYKHMLEKQCQVFYTVKGPKGNKIRKGKLIKELSIEVLPSLTHEEIKDLATKQAMANSISD